MYLVTVEINGKESVKSFDDQDGVINLYLNLAKGKLDSGTKFCIKRVDLYLDGRVIEQYLSLSYSGIILMHKSVLETSGEELE